jgi:D-cysteine desulfhydrase
MPDRLYVATGTMGTPAGLAIGLALAGLQTEVHAVRVSHTAIANEHVLARLISKTVHMLRRLEAAVPEHLEQECRVRLRHAFFAGGYAHSDDNTEDAIRLSADAFGIQLESTYSGKAMAALLHDIRTGEAKGRKLLFWNTYSSVPLPTGSDAPAVGSLPADFFAYFS